MKTIPLFPPGTLPPPLVLPRPPAPPPAVDGVGVAPVSLAPVQPDRRAGHEVIGDRMSAAGDEAYASAAKKGFKGSGAGAFIKKAEELYARASVSYEIAARAHPDPVTARQLMSKAIDHARLANQHDRAKELQTRIKDSPIG